MIDNFDKCLYKVLEHEGGWANHPSDPGGATMKGVTIGTFRSFFGADKTPEDLHNITDKQLKTVYKVGYWDKCKCSKLPTAVDFLVFDAAVNSGVRRSSQWLQRCVGSYADGIIGPNTIDAVSSVADKTLLVEDLCDIRLEFLKSLSNWEYFGGGWSNRVEGNRDFARSMLEECC